MGQLQDGWYAVQVRPKAERFVAHLLDAKGYEPFVPLYQQRKRWSDRVKVLELPLIPNYVFCRATDETFGAIVTTPGVVRIVGAGRTPLPIDADEMDALRRIDGYRLRAEPFPFFRVGQLVEIQDGALRGVRGVLLRVKSAHRLVVSVSLLQRSVAVELDDSAVFGVVGDLIA